MIVLLLVALVGRAKPAEAAPVRILIAAGASTGLPGDPPLNHPLRDATKVREVFTSLGQVRGDEAILLHDPSKAALLAAFDRAQAIARRHAMNEVTLIFYFSGHGDQEALHLRGETLAIADLRGRLMQVPAGLRLVVVDACRTKEVLRAKGMNVQPGFTIKVPSQPPASGVVWLFASADGEAAQESDEIGGALFTHFWLAGLRGAADTNVDGRVTLEEAFTYGYNQTLFRSSRSGGVLQRPEKRLELTESAPLVLTEISKARAQLELPREADALYLVYAVGAQSVIAEVLGVSDRPTRLALPAGRYIVQKRMGARGAATEAALSAGAVHVVSASDFRPFSGEVLAQKGDLVYRPWSIAVGDMLYAGTAADFGNEPFVRLERREGSWAYALSALGGWASDTKTLTDVKERYVGGELAFDYLLTLGNRSLFRFGLDARAQWIWQAVERNDVGRLLLAGYSDTDRTYSGAALGGGAHAGVRFTLGPRLHVDGGVRAITLGTNTEAGLATRLFAGSWLLAGMSL